MDTLTITLDPDTIEALRERAEGHGVSVEQEARDLIASSVQTISAPAISTSATGWRLKATKEQLASLGRTPSRSIDYKAESDALYGYLDRE